MNATRRPCLPAISLSLLACGLVLGCSVVAALRAVKAPPGLAPTIDQFAGTLLTGPLGADAAARIPTAPEQALALRVRLLLLDELTETDEGATPLVDSLALVTGLKGSSPIRATSRLAAGGTIARGDAAHAILERLAAEPTSKVLAAGELSTVVLIGATTIASFTSSDGSSLTVTVQGRDATHAPLALELAPAGDEGELVKLAEELAADRGETLLVTVPSPFKGSDAPACALAIELLPSPRSPPATAEELADHAAAVTAAIAAITRLPAAVPRAEVGRGPVGDALRALTTSADSRATLVHLASSAQARLLGDVALSASDDELVALLTKLVGERERLLGEGTTRETLDWEVEHAAWRFVVQAALDGDLAVEPMAALYRHAGALADWPSTLEDVVEDSADAAALGARLVAENQLLLADRESATRVRAFDWLTARAVAPAGYDPLGPADQRRAALAAVAEKEPRGG